MKICILTQTLDLQTGAGVFTGNLIEGVRRINPQTEFFVMTSEEHIKPSIYKILKNWRGIRDKIRKADLVHALDAYPYGVVACIANIGISKPVIITAVGSGSVGKLNGVGWKSSLLRWAYKRATIVTAISHYVAKEIKKVLPNLSIEVINHGVDYNFYAEKPDEGNVKNILVFDYIITIGELKRRKGYTEILPIMKKVMQVHQNLKYVIVANTNRNEQYRDELYDLIEKLGIKDRVIIKSDLNRKGLRDAYQKALLYLTLPKNVNGDVEGFGLTIMEAAASGTPVIVGKGSGADDAILDKQSGFLVDGGNQDEVVEKILAVIKNKELRKRLSDGASKWARENGWESKIKHYTKLYEKI